MGEVQKRIERYKFDDDTDGFLGNVPNNYTLKVDIPKKTYAVDDEIPVNINPYQKGARVVVTVERGQYIVDQYLKQLDGSPLTITAKRSYAPNVIVQVMQLVGSDQADARRKEPRFYA